jgi:hypothetical protein
MSADAPDPAKAGIARTGTARTGTAVTGYFL